MKKVVLTGATGFLGYALLRELTNNGVFVYALCRKNSRRLERLSGVPNVSIIEADLNSDRMIDGLEGCDVFYHLAWEGKRDDFTEQYRNVEISVNCLRLAARLKCKRFLCTGSQAEYGSRNEMLTEETLLNPNTSYGACKAAAYYLTADLAQRLDIEHTWVRVFSVYGPHDNPNTLIMSLARELDATGKASLHTNGKHMWNYLFEEDAARALRLLGAHSQSNAVYQLASRHNKPLNEFVGELLTTSYPHAHVQYGSETSSVNLNVCTKKLRNAIGEYETTAFVDGISRVCDV